MHDRLKPVQPPAWLLNIPGVSFGPSDNGHPTLLAGLSWGNEIDAVDLDADDLRAIAAKATELAEWLEKSRIPGA